MNSGMFSATIYSGSDHDR